MWLFKIKGKAKIPDYIQIRDEKMILVDYFRADRPIEKFKKYGILNDEKKIIDLVNNLEYGKLLKVKSPIFSVSKSSSDLSEPCFDPS